MKPVDEKLAEAVRHLRSLCTGKTADVTISVRRDGRAWLYRFDDSGKEMWSRTRLFDTLESGEVVVLEGGGK